MKPIVPRSVRRIALFALPLAILAQASLSAKAASTPWIDSEGARIRILASPPDGAGNIRGAVQIDLKPGWVTYWRNPGETGVPPQLATDGSENVKSAALGFPPPVALDEGGAAAIGYDSPVALPLTLVQATPGRASRLDAHLFIGVCKEICVPVKADYTLDIPASAPTQSSVATMTIDEAYAGLPKAAGQDFSMVGAALGPDRKTIKVEIRVPSASAGKPSLFVDGPSGWSFAPSKLQAIENGIAQFLVPLTGSPKEAGAGGRFVFVARAGSRSIEATRVLR